MREVEGCQLKLNKRENENRLEDYHTVHNTRKLFNEKKLIFSEKLILYLFLVTSLNLSFLSKEQEIV